MSLHKNDIVRLTPKGPVGQVTRLPRQQAGEPPLAYVRWTATGKVSRHDQRTLIVVDDITDLIDPEKGVRVSRATAAP